MTGVVAVGKKCVAGLAGAATLLACLLAVPVQEAHAALVDPALVGIGVKADGKPVDHFLSVRTDYELPAKPGSMEVTNVPAGWSVDQAHVTGSSQTSVSASASLDFHLGLNFTGEDISQLKSAVGADFKPAYFSKEQGASVQTVLQDFDLDHFLYLGLNLSSEQLANISFNRQELRAQVQAARQAGFDFATRWYDAQGNEIYGMLNTSNVHYVNLSITKDYGKNMRSLDYVFSTEKDISILVGTQLPNIAALQRNTWTLDPAAIGPSSASFTIRPTAGATTLESKSLPKISLGSSPVTYTFTYAKDAVATSPAPGSAASGQGQSSQPATAPASGDSAGAGAKSPATKSPASATGDSVPSQAKPLNDPTGASSQEQADPSPVQQLLAKTGSPIIVLVVLALALAIGSAYVFTLRSRDDTPSEPKQ
ncbi:hypothetical protein KIM372_14450 [Bombiscardovia nodaiensis]|uniref:Cell surface protein n=1 Tax=Bombiscardovia nodaiensis TaxID=2932181 RepID=A0ABM8B9I1_9BIFI|nr:hypothetical protein KIM372_14450 [Bombiscardovia nodaiensis]